MWLGAEDESFWTLERQLVFSDHIHVIRVQQNQSDGQMRILDSRGQQRATGKGWPAHHSPERSKSHLLAILWCCSPPSPGLPSRCGPWLSPAVTCLSLVWASFPPQSHHCPCSCQINCAQMNPCLGVGFCEAPNSDTRVPQVLWLF